MLLVCGTRGSVCADAVKQYLTKFLEENGPFQIIHGACPDSADEESQKWAELHNITTIPFPSTSGNYLKRNVEMVALCNHVVAFWDGWSYGTAHTVSHGALKGVPIDVIKVRKYHKK